MNTYLPEKLRTALPRLPRPEDRPETYLPAKFVKDRYSVSDMALHRWGRDPRLKFPKPLRIQGRKY